MGKTLYLECYTGISGDMTVAALLDLGADREVLEKVMKSLPVQGFRTKISRVSKAGLDVCDFDVILDAEHENHDHDMEYLYGHLCGEGQGGSHVHEAATVHSHEHEDVAEHEHEHAGEHEHRHEHMAEHRHEHVYGAERSHEHVQREASGYEHEHAQETESVHDHVRGMEHRHEVAAEHSHGYVTGHSHEHEHGHATEHSHEHGHHHEHRGLPEILAIIDAAKMAARAKETARKIFTVLAEAEAKAHGVPVDQVHFHEVGAIDSIVDILAVAVCLDTLDITEVIVPYLCEGMGTVRCQHGILPVPVPAVANIVQKAQIPLRITGTQGELVTPTGAAIAAAIRTEERMPECFTIQKIGIGAGKRNYGTPSLLRAMLLERQETQGDPVLSVPQEKRGDLTLSGPQEPRSESALSGIQEMWSESALSVTRNAQSGQVLPGPQDASARQNDGIYKLETNIDDCTGEALGHVMERLLESGARDVHFVPVYMKKNRPAYELNVICSEELVPTLEEIIFKETTTIGIRRVRMERTVLQREADTVTLPCGELVVKKCMLPDGEVRCYPEYESVAKLAKEQGLSFWQVMELFHHVEDEDGGGTVDAEAWL